MCIDHTLIASMATTSTRPLCSDELTCGLPAVTGLCWSITSFLPFLCHYSIIQCPYLSTVPTQPSSLLLPHICLYMLTAQLNWTIFTSCSWIENSIFSMHRLITQYQFLLILPLMSTCYPCAHCSSYLPQTTTDSFSAQSHYYLIDFLLILPSCQLLTPVLSAAVTDVTGMLHNTCHCPRQQLIPPLLNHTHTTSSLTVPSQPSGLYSICQHLLSDWLSSLS